ncbi:acyl-CoA N-acyltransferase [Meredithblackwellia eburnea MCA 4105]
MSTYAFEPSLLPPSLHAKVPTGLTLRPLSLDDYSRKHLLVLADLTSCPDTGEERWKERFTEMVSIKDTYFPVVFVQSEGEGDVVATGTLVLERKFLRNLGIVGHIEDIAVGSKAQGKGLGKLMIEVLTMISEAKGAYKTILDCDVKNEGFYVKCGYENKGVEMAKYKAH